MASFTNAWDETIPLDNSLTGLSEAGKLDDLIRQLKLDIRERITKFMPPGMIIKWSSEILPFGFKELNGESLLRANFPALFTVLGTYYGTADSLHFNIPNWQNRYPRGWNNGKSSGIYDPDSSTRTKPNTTATMSAGDHVGTEQDDENISHLHTYFSAIFLTGLVNGNTGLYPYNQTWGQTDSAGTENRPKSVYKKYIIRVDDFNPLDGTYSYDRPWDETIPTNATYYGRMALEIRKLREDVEVLIDNFFPTGMEIFWPGSSAPDGYVEENGQAISRTTYAELFDLIGDFYGEGDGDTTFNVPDARGLFIRCDDGSSLGDEIDDDIKSHTHLIGDQVSGTGFGFSAVTFMQVEASISIMYGTDVTSGDPARTVDGHPKNMYLMPCIRARKCA